MWQPSANNPNRAAVATYSTRLDAIVISILGRGTGLSATGFTTYLKNLSTGITALAAGPKYANDAEVQKISAYLTYELTDTATALSSGNMFMDDLIVLVNNTGGVQCPNFTAPPAPPTGCNYVSNPPNANGCATPMTLVCANTGTVANSGGTVTTVAPTIPGITSLTSVQLASSTTYSMVWTKVTGVDYFTAIDAGTSAGGNNVGGISTWAIPLSGFAPGSTHTANVKACNTGTSVCSGWSTVNIGITENSSATAPVFNFTTAEYTVAKGTTVKLNWYQMTGVSTCVAGGDWSGNKPVAGGGNGGSENITIQSAKNFTLTCTGPTGLSTTKTIAITMLPPPENPPVDAVCGSLAGQ